MRYYRLILWTLIVSIMCFTPGNQIDDIKINIPHFDKVVHFIMFMGFAFFIRGGEGLNSKQKRFLIVVAIIYAAIIEVVQHMYVPMRNGDILDFIADVLGFTVGYFVYCFLPAFLKKLTA